MITKLKQFIASVKFVALFTSSVSFLIFGAITPAEATQSALVWWQPSPSTNATGYKIYYGVSSGSYTNYISVGNVTNVQVSGLIEGTTYYFAARAVDTSGDKSALSPEVSYTVPPPTSTLASHGIAPNGFSFTVNGSAGYTYVVQMSSNLLNWIPVLTNAAPFTFVDTNARAHSQRFYRSVHYP